MIDWTPTLWDHALAAAFALGFPALTAPVYLRRRPALLAGDAAVRLREYRETIAWLSAMGVATLSVWLGTGRSPGLLGLAWEGDAPSVVGLLVALCAAALLTLQTLSIQRDAATREAARQAFFDGRDFMPTTPHERRLFRGVSVAAGIGEELFFRGFLIAYLSTWLPLIWAVAASSVAFGLVHIMHGIRATMRSTLLGAVLAALVVASGSLWPAIILHTAIDWTSAEAGYAILGPDGVSS